MKGIVTQCKQHSFSYIGQELGRMQKARKGSTSKTLSIVAGAWHPQRKSAGRLDTRTLNLSILGLADGCPLLQYKPLRGSP